MKKLSVIIPLYNAEAYVAKCLESICGQQDIPLSTYEVIVVNDESPDNSRDVVVQLAAKYDNIIIKDQPNGGASAARNNGLGFAQGEYVIFADADDYFEENRLGQLVEILDANRPELLSFTFTTVNEEGTPITNRSCTRKCTTYPNHHFLSQDELCNPAVWAYVFRRDFLDEHQLRFIEGIVCEDLEFTPRAVSFAKTIVHWDCPFYRYVIRNVSVTHSPRLSLHRINSYEKVFESLLDFVKQHDMAPRLKSAFGKLFELHSRIWMDMCREHGDPAVLDAKRRFLQRNRLLPFCYKDWNMGWCTVTKIRLQALKRYVKKLLGRA